MSRSFLILISCSVSIAAYTQNYFELTFGTPQTITCPYDGVTVLNDFPNWEVYQTADNLWDGPHDALCIDEYLPGETYSLSVRPWQVDINRPVFIRYLMPTEIPIMPNEIYDLNTGILNSSLGLLDIEENSFCDGLLCNGYLLGIEVPVDEFHNPEGIRWYSNTLAQNQSQEEIHHCFASESFEDPMKLREFVLVIKFLPESTAAFKLTQIPSLYALGGWVVNVLNTASLPNYYTGNHTFSFWEMNNFVQYEAPTYPSSTQPWYLDIYPNPNSTTQETLTLNFNGNLLVFQPYAFFRGGLVEGSDEVRHNFELVNYSSTFCVDWVEFVFAPHNSYVHEGGQINLGLGGCLRFEPGASLVVGKEQTLQYGHQGVGMLALHSNCIVEFRENAALVIDNTIALFDNAWEPEPQPIEIVLKPGNSLVFAKFAHVVDKSTGTNMKLRIVLQGGYLDIGALDEEDLKHIEIIYPQQSQALAILSVFGNPVSDVLQLNFHAAQKDLAEMRITDTSGRVIFKNQEPIREGYNLLQIPLAPLSRGSYLLSISTEFGREVLPFVKE